MSNKMGFYLEKYKQEREKLMTSLGRYVLNQTGVESLKEFKQKFVVIAVEELDELTSSSDHGSGSVNGNDSNELTSFNLGNEFERL